MPTRLAINGFGRIGRAVVRAAVERGADLEIVAINDIADVETLAYLLRLDSVYGRFGETVVPEADAIVVGDRRIRGLAEPDPGTLPLEELGAEVVIEATGRFRTRAAAARHLEAGARKVILSAPAKGAEPADADVVLGVNFDAVYDPERHHVVKLDPAGAYAYAIDLDYCKGCGICAQECPSGAIQMEPEEV
jgi:glyceraldehyde 3-phosphate dehydrogenase